jgi:sec-independent protein translocase protein TatA
MLGNFSYGEMLLVGVVALILFGSRLPEVARNLGGSYRQLKKHLNDFQREFQAAERYEPPKKSTNEVESNEVPTDDPKPKAPRFIPPPADDDESKSPS